MGVLLKLARRAHVICKIKVSTVMVEGLQDSQNMTYVCRKASTLKGNGIMVVELQD